MMYILPQNPSDYGVQRVAAVLPNYALRLKFYLPLLFIYEHDNIVLYVASHQCIYLHYYIKEKKLLYHRNHRDQRHCQ